MAFVADADVGVGVDADYGVDVDVDVAVVGAKKVADYRLDKEHFQQQHCQYNLHNSYIGLAAVRRPAVAAVVAVHVAAEAAVVAVAVHSQLLPY